MKKIIQSICLITALFFVTTAKAQLSGSYAVPATFTSVAAAINSLNIAGVSGPVSIDIAAGYTETVSVGGFTLNSITGASATNTITFQKSGVGANPILYAYAGGTAVPSSAIQDGIWRFAGTDYVTINGIDLNDPNTANPATMEFGYGFFKASATNGCQNNSIMNCTITLNRINNDAGSTPAMDGSRGIDVVNASTATHTTAITVTSAAGSNSNNKFYSNTIQNCNIGIALIGFADVTPFALADTGNDIGGSSSATGNTIINFGGGGTTSASAGIQTVAQYGINVSYNTLNNNTGSGVLSAQILRGIYLNTATSANATINSNTLSLKGGGTSQQLSVIENVSGSTAATNTITINNNLINNCTNASNTSGTFYGIWNGSSAANLIITGNTFTNNTTNATSANVYLVYNSGAVPGIINMSNNNLSQTFNNASTAYSGTNYNVYNNGGTLTSTLTIDNNNFSNYSFTNVLATGGAMYFVYNTNSSSVCNVDNNTWNNLSLNTSGALYLIYNSTSTQNALAVTNNSIITGLTKLGATAAFYCYYSGASSLGTSTQVFSGNNFSNITSTVTGSGTFYGIYTSDGATSPYPKKTVFNNIISNNFIGTTSTSYAMMINYLGDGSTASGSSVYSNTISNMSFAGTCYGLYLNTTASPTYPINAYLNTVSGFTSTGSSSSVYGSYSGGSAAGTNYYKNKITDIYETGGTGVVYGLYISSGTNGNYYNNLVGNIFTPASTGANRANGIYIGGGTSMNIYYNSVYLNATSTGANFGSNAMYANTTPNVNLMNNIFVNNSTPSGTEFATAYKRSSNSLLTYSATSNNNLFYAGTPGASHLIFYDGTTGFQTLAAFKTLPFLGTREILSVTENPTFVSTTGSNANFLNINTTTPTQIESGAAIIAGITDDFAGTVRSVTAPDIGAWEGGYIINDVSGPALMSSAFTTPPCTLSGRTFTANLADADGVATGLLAPRIYYKVNAGAYTSVAGTLASGTTFNGVWSFNMVYAASVNDVISFYLVAQDAFATPNLAAFPATGFAGTDVNTITTPPTTPNSFPINSMSGVYTVGAAGTFTSLTAAAYAYNNYCLTGAVTFSLVDALYSTAETFPIVFQNFNGQASATNSLLIIPATGIAVAITPTNTSINSAIKFLDARYITIDGLNAGGSSITINNSNVSSASANIWLASSNALVSGNNFIAIKNTTLKGGYNTGSNGVIASIDGPVPSGTGGNDNDNITISGNTFLTFYHGILAVGSSSVSSGGLDNWVISNNIMGATTSGATDIGANGVIIANALNLAVTGNTIQNINTASTAGIAAININGNTTGFSISQNLIKNLTSSATTGGVTGLCGVYLGSSVMTGTVSKNNVTTISNTNSGGYGARGIIINTTNSLSAISINNNFISDISCMVDQGTSWWPIGIAIEGSSGGIDIDFNSVNLFGGHAGYSSASAGTGAAPLFIGGTTGNLNVRNNLFSNTYDNTTQTTDVAYGIYSAVASTNFLNINYNDYYVGGSAGTLVMGYLGANQLNLAAIQTAFGGNLNSKNILPVFVSNTDLHMQLVGGNAALDNQGTPLVGITVDIDNQARSITTPDMGADEYTVPVCTSANGGVLTVASATACAGQTLVATSTGVSTGLTTSYLWKVGATAGGPYVPVTGGTGSTTTSYTSAPLPSGVYYIRLETICAAASLTATSNEGTLTVNALPTVTASSSAATICAGSNLNLSGSGSSTTFTWTGPNGFTSTSQNTVITTASSSVSGVYTLMGSNAVCTSTASTLLAIVNPKPLTLTLTPTTASICSGASQTITSLGGAVNSTLNFGTQANQNGASTTSSGYPAPYSAYYGGQRMQILVLASELLSAGFIANTPINNIQFPVVSLGGNWGTSITSNQNFQVNIGPTALTSLSTFQSGLTNVVAAANFVPAVGYGNTHTFSTPYIWNGTSNIILETTFSNNFAGAAGDVVVQYNSPTSFQSTVLYRNDSQTAGVVAASSTVSFVYNARPDFKLNGTSLGTFLWTPSTGLSSTTSSSVTATPATTTTYTLTSNLGSCSTNTNITVNIIATPTINIAASSTTVCAGDAATLTASGATSYSWNPTTTTNTFVVNPPSTTVYTVTGQNQNCAAVTATVSIATNSLPVVTAVSSSTLVCTGQNATLTASGATNYAWVSGPLTNTYVIVPTANTTYSVTGTGGNGCTAQATIAIATGTTPVLTVSPPSAIVCMSSSASFTAAGAATYSWSSGSLNASVNFTPTTASSSYTVTGFSAAGCSTTQVVLVTANPLPAVVVSPASPTICSNESLVLTASGAANYSWTPGTIATTTLMVNPSTTSSSYTVEGVDANNCRNTMSVMVTVDPCTGIKEQNSLSGNVSLYPNPSTGLIIADFGFDGSKEIIVLNSVGALVMKAFTEELSTTFDLSGYAKGVYFVHVKTNGASANYKIVIQ